MIRLMNASDISAVVELENSTLGDSLGEDMLSKYVDNEFCIAYVIENDKKVIGYISCNFDQEVLEICNLCIDNIYQNQGLGTKLLAYALNEAYIAGAQTAIIDVKHTNARALYVYERLGFKKIHVRKQYYKTGEDAIVLQKQFTPFMDVEDAFLQCYGKMEYHDGYVKIYDDIQKDKYYHNYYRIFDKNVINSLMDKPYGANILQFQYCDKLDEFENDAYQINNDINMTAFISNIEPIKEPTKKGTLLTEENRNAYINFSFNDAKKYGEAYAMNNAVREAQMALDEKKIKLFIIKNDNKDVIGALTCFIYNDMVKFESFYIDEAFHHKGYGTALFMTAVEYIKENHKKVLQVLLVADNLDTPKDMYYKMGLRKCGEYYLYRKK